MAILWQTNRGTVRGIYEQLRAQRSIAYTTVMTTMSRLAEKGILAQEKAGDSRAYIYTPLHTKDELMITALRQMFSDLQATTAERHEVLRSFGAGQLRI